MKIVTFYVEVRTFYDINEKSCRFDEYSYESRLPTWFGGINLTQKRKRKSR